MDIIKLTPAVKDFIWGGRKLQGYGKVGDKIAETWELSFHEAGYSLTPDGRPLAIVATKKDLGLNVEGFDFFPMLIKLIDAEDNLSVQVHPSDEYSLKNEGQLGKTEMWYIVEAEEGAGIYLGFKRDVTPEEFAAAIENGTALDLLNFVKVKAGEHYFIKSGTVHAIGKGCTICEIQQNSNVTYRVYDYGRKDANGNGRPLHIEKAKAVACLKGASPLSPVCKMDGFTVIGVSKYFTVYAKDVCGGAYWNVDIGSFCAISVVSGNGTVDGTEVKTGDTLFVPAGYGSIELDGKMKLLLSTVRTYTAERSGDILIVKDDLGREVASACGNKDTRALADIALAPLGADNNDLKTIREV